MARSMNASRLVSRILRGCIVGAGCLLLAGGMGAAWQPHVVAELPRGEPDAPPDVFADYLATPYWPADGFDFPVGDRDGAGTYEGSDGRTHRGWYVATKFGEDYALGIHPGEDWNGRGGGNTDLGQ